MVRDSRFWALVGTLCLSLITVVMFGLAVLPLKGLAKDEALGRARLVANEVTGQIQHAIDLNIPVHDLVGIEALFEQNIQSFPELLRVELRDASDRLWFAAGTERIDASLPALHLPLREQERHIAEVVVYWKSTQWFDFVRYNWLPLVALWAFSFVLMREALRMSLACYPGNRHDLVRRASERIQAGALDFAIASDGRCDHDMRPQWLAARLRHVREQFQRLERITQSLLRTEPDLAVREQLERGLKEACGEDHLQAQAVTWLTGSVQPARQRWHGLLIGLLAWLPLAWPVGAWWALQLLVPLSVLIGGALWLPSLLHWHARAGLQGLLLGGLVVGPGIAGLLQVGFAPALLEGTDVGFELLLALQSLLAWCAGLWPEQEEASDVT